MEGAPNHDDKSRRAETGAGQLRATGSGETPTATGRWVELVERIRAGDPGGMEQLYAIFSRGVRFYLCRQIGPEELDDRVHDTFLIVVQAIQRGELREPERLMGFVRTVVRRQVAAYIERAVQTRRGQTELHPGLPVSDSRSNPEQELLARQKVEIMLKVLQGISRRDREILTRFYLLGQSQQQICREMKLTETQFRLLKSRAKARFGELGRRRLKRRFAFLKLRDPAGPGH
ncbi:MAG: sigma-70 family RNA polymerase sigma factor [Bryobacterales bacterium]|nr:sigma-70 family RNA polymerase sigma factor [Bryobacteraceae bacterium]MDW8130664.1 sigma-70 family RNA polymerase sigma factor [Bryobacterales bacterium]